MPVWLQRAHLQELRGSFVLPYGDSMLPSGWAAPSRVPAARLACMTVLPRAAPTRSGTKHADKGKGSDLEMTK